MLIHKLRIDSQMFYLDPDEDIPRLMQEVFDAARGPAKFTVFHPIGHGKVSVLMTPHTPVRFEEQERTEEEIGQWENDPPHIDFLDFGTFDAA